MPDVYEHEDASTATGERYEWITTGEAARMLKISISTLQRWDNAGHFPAHRTPFTKQRRYKPKDVERLRDELYPGEGELSA